MSNKDLFKQAIAEAKTIREAAITNAKEALEESLTPHLKEMLAQKLQEMEDAEDTEEIVNEEDMMNDPEGETAHGNVAEAEEEEAEEEGEEAEEEGEEVEEEELDLENMSVEEFKDLVRDIVAQEIGHDESEEEMPGEETPAGEEDMVSMDGDSEEIDINELLAELEGMEKEEPINEMGPEYIEGAAQLVEMFPFLTMQTASLVIGALGAAGLAGFSAIAVKVQDMALAGKFGGSAKSFAEKLQAAGGAAAKATQNREGVEAVNEEVENIDENIDIIYELIDMFPFLTNSTAQMLLGVFGAVGITGLSAIAAKIHQMAEDGVFGEAGKKLGNKLTSLGKDAASARNVSEESAELEEALATVAELRTQLQEVNLLNAKLLYVNKVFKANNLTESQKVNVVAAFDRAETVKEVKLVFETVSKNVVAKPAAIKEHKSFASSAAGTAATAGKKEIISEVSEQVARWQKLAGIIK
jgi:hypothetical protein